MTQLAHAALPGTPIWMPHNAVISAAVVLIAFIYLRTATTYGVTGPAGTRKRSTFIAGLVVLWLSLDGPIEALSGSVYIAHMVQHILVTLVAPPLIIGGLTAQMFHAVLGNGRFLRLVRRLARPLTALLLFNGTLAFSHAPVVVEWMLQSEPFHYVIHLILLGTACIMWLPVTSPSPQIRKLSYPAGMGYLLLQSILPTVPASFLTFGSEPLYPVYNDVTPLWGMAALTDQQIAGLIMKIGGGAILWGIVVVMFFRWASHEERSTWRPVSAGDDEAPSAGLDQSPSSNSPEFANGSPETLPRLVDSALPKLDRADL